MLDSDIGSFLDGKLAEGGDDGGAGEGTPVVGASDLGVNDDGASESLPEGDTFKREYVEKLRRESAGYRDRAKRYQDAFDGYDDDAVGEWLEYVKGLRQDPQGTARRMQQLSKGILDSYEVNEEGDIQPEGTAERLGEQARPLTMADYERLRSSEREEHQRETLVRKIESDARDLGYDVGSMDYKLLLNTAMELPDGNIQKAHEKLQARDQAVIDKYVEAARLNGGRRLPPTGTATGQQETQIKTFEQSRDAFEEYLAAQPL